MDDIIKAVGSGGDLQKAVEDALSLPRSQQEELLTSLGKLKSALAGQFLALLYPRLSDKALQKLVKKGLFRLKTSGIAVEAPEVSGESVLRKVETFRDAMALMSNYDGALTRIVLAAAEVRKNQFLFAHAVTHFTDGLLEMRSFTISRTQVEEITRDYVARTESPMALVSVSPLYAGYIIEEAAGISGRELEDARSLNRMLAAAKGDAKKPADIYRLKAAADAAPASAETVLRDDMFRPFMLEWQGIDEDRKELKGAVSPAIVLPPSAVMERKAAFFEKLVRKEVLRPIFTRFKRMMEDTAYLFFCLGEFDLYGGLLELLREPESLQGTFAHFLDKTLTEIEKKEQQQQQPGVIVDPYSLPRR